ncbi:MAG: TraR/DksA family transcriptional regulator [Actinomycetes bacterium]
MESSATTNIDDEHDPEGATVAYERAQMHTLLDQARGRLDEIDRAVAALRSGEYGTCERCGQPIGAPRLAARPATRRCRSCADLPREPA